MDEVYFFPSSPSPKLGEARVQVFSAVVLTCSPSPPKLENRSRPSSMAERMEAAATGDDDYTQDGTVDLRGNPVLRSKRGGWKACGFVVGKQQEKELIQRTHKSMMHPSCMHALFFLF